MQLVHRYGARRPAFDWKSATDLFIFIVAILILLGTIIAVLSVLMKRERAPSIDERPAQSANLQRLATLPGAGLLALKPGLECLRGGPISNS